MFSRLEESSGLAGFAAPGAEAGTHSAAADGIYLGLPSLAAVGPGSAGREATSLFRATASARPSRHTENPECPLHGSLSTLRPPLGTTGPRTLDTNSFSSGGRPRDRYAFFLLALKTLHSFRKFRAHTFKGPSFLTRGFTSSKPPCFLDLLSHPAVSRSHLQKPINHKECNPLALAAIPQHRPFKLGDGKTGENRREQRFLARELR